MKTKSPDKNNENCHCFPTLITAEFYTQFMTAIGKLTQLVFECHDPHRAADFWKTILDLPAGITESDWVTLEWKPVGRFSFHRVANYQPPTWPGDKGDQQVHFDLLVDDLAEASMRVENAGGRPLTEILDPGPKAWRIYADPDGHPFCLVSVPE